MAAFSHQMLLAVTRSRGSYLLSKRNSCSSLSSKAYLHVEPPPCQVSSPQPLRHSHYGSPHCYRGRAIDRGQNPLPLVRSLHSSGVWLQEIKQEDTKTATQDASPEAKKSQPPSAASPTSHQRRHHHLHHTGSRPAGAGEDSREKGSPSEDSG
uniref:Uncharacterized protein n=1 Tax=Gasterosteus aculeatus TaxID=69293 RepID=G3NQ37_GASAC